VSLRYAAGMALALLFLGGCSPKHLIVQGVGNELASQTQLPEDDLVLAREASAFYLKLSEGLLAQTPDNAKLSESVATGFTQYAYAFVSFEAERIESRDVRAAQSLRARAARLYLRANRHAMAALERAQPGFRKALDHARPGAEPGSAPAHSPVLLRENIGLAYWAAASWGGYISLSKDSPDIVADLPLVIRLAQLAYAKDPRYGDGALAALMGTLETVRAGGSQARALQYFDEAIAFGAERSAGPWVAKAESISLPSGNRIEFETLLAKALAISVAHPDLQNTVMRERTLWLLGITDELF
jgi:predicted anti-sigma-YlaC factor YlaD